MAGKPLWVVAALGLTMACSTATPGSRASAELKDKDGKTVGRARLSERSNGVLIRLEVRFC